MHRIVLAIMRPGLIAAWLILLVAPAMGQSIESTSAYTIPSPQLAGDALLASHTQTPSQRQVAGKATPRAADFPALADPDAGRTAGDEAVGGAASPMITVVSSLAVVLGLFATLIWLTRRFGGGAVRAGAMPSDVIQNLGSTPLDSRTRVTMLRCGNRIVVAAQTAGGVHPLCEITDPSEVAEVTAACTGQSPPSFADSSRVRQAVEEPTAAAMPDARRRGRLFASA
jgi:flagellar biogenesis protein FliO